MRSLSADIERVLATEGWRPGDALVHGAAVLTGIVTLTVAGVLVPARLEIVTVADLAESDPLGAFLATMACAAALALVGAFVGFQVAHRLVFGRFAWPFAPRASRRRRRGRPMRVAWAILFSVTLIGSRVIGTGWIPNAAGMYTLPGPADRWLMVSDPTAVLYITIATLLAVSVLYAACIVVVAIVAPPRDGEEGSSAIGQPST